MVKFFCDCCGKELKKESDGYRVILPLRDAYTMSGGIGNRTSMEIFSWFSPRERQICYTCLQNIGLEIEDYLNKMGRE